MTNDITLHFKPETLPHTLRAMRLQAKMTQTQAAHAIGMCSTSAISHYETGKRNISIMTFAKLADAYGYEVNVRFFEKSKQNEGKIDTAPTETTSE